MTKTLTGFEHIKVPCIEQWRDEGRAVGRQEGLAEGLQEGLQKGLQKGLRQAREVLILAQLKSRFPRLGATLQKRVQKLPDALLEELGLALLRFEQPAQLTEWLNQRGA